MYKKLLYDLMFILMNDIFDDWMLMTPRYERYHWRSFEAK